MKLDTIQLRVKQVAGGHEDRVEMEQLVYEECDTEDHEVRVPSNQSATVDSVTRRWSTTGSDSRTAVHVTPPRRISQSGAS